MHKYRIVSFDMDGTLTLGTTCLQYYVKMLGRESRAKKLEDLYRDHEVDDYQIADAYAEIIGGVTRRQLYEWTKEIPRMKNIGEAVNALKKLGLIVGITSVGPSFASEVFQELFKFDFISGSEHKFVNDVHAGQMVKTLTGKDKIGILESICKEKKVSMLQVIAVGDSRSDLPIFEKVGYKIALNADENLKDNTDFFIKSDNLLNVSDKVSGLSS